MRVDQAAPAPFRRFRRSLILVLLLLALGGCASQALRWTPASHTVEAGETLYSIAWRYGLDYRVLAKWNGIPLNGVIHPGQQLRLLPPPAGTVATKAPPKSRPGKVPAPPVKVTAPPAQPVGNWQWPARGRLAGGFADPQALARGIDIAGKMGDSVVAASGGNIVYAGSGLIGYGKLIIVKHNKTFLSAYGHNSELLVVEGDQVVSGQRIARMGLGPGNTPLLHFEIRLNGEPVDPLKYLPRR